MAISITQTSQSTDRVQVQVSGLDPNYPIKSLEYYINGSFWGSYDTTSGGSSVQFVIANLSSNTSYTLQVKAFTYYTIAGFTDWWPDPSSGNNTNSIIISTASGGGDSPYYTYSVTNTSVTITIHNIGSGYYYSFWIRDANDSITIYDTEEQSSRVTTNPFTIPVTLSPNTTYLIKQVGYTTRSSSPTSSLIPIEYLYYGSGNQSIAFTTSGSGPTPSGSGKIYIFHGSRWISAKPYIFHGSRWVPASPYIFDGSQWRPCT